MKGFYAAGRMKSGALNKTEQEYEQAFLAPKLRSGEILWYKFEAIKLKISEKCFYTPDFAVLPKSKIIEFHEVKGAFVMDDSIVKIKAASELFPFVFLLCKKQSKRRGGGWEIAEI